MKPMLASKFMGQKVTGYLMSEKLDGVRAIWDGNNLLSRNGNIFNAPKWFTNQLPNDLMLDGELYIGAGKFQETVGIVRTKIIDKGWEKITYCVFDAPQINECFANRISFISKKLSHIPYLKIVEQIPIKSDIQMKGFLDSICNEGGEGIILRDPNSMYEQRRSDKMLKYKPFETSEAILIGYEKGSGKYTNVIGTLICKWKNKIIRLGSGISDDIRQNGLLLNTPITFQFNGLTNDGMPRFPIFLCSRDYE